MLERYTLNSFAVIALIFAPWWVFLLAPIAGTLLFGKYYEILALTFLYDVLYASQAYIITIVGVVLFLLITLFKRNFNLHEKKITRHG